MEAIKKSDRLLTKSEFKKRYRGLPFFNFDIRKNARLEFRRNKAEILEFTVRAAWNLLICDGPPCCPNTWLLMVDEKTFVYVSSWKHLRAQSRDFPGSNVTIDRLPFTKRMLDGTASGKRVPAYLLTGNAHADLVTLVSDDVAILAWDALPKSVQNLVGKSKDQQLANRSE